MKLSIHKTLDAGRYRVYVQVSDLTTEETAQMRKFGSPEISIKPKTTIFNWETVSSLPLHAISHNFEFESEALASQFIDEMKSRIKEAISILKNRKDNFTNVEEYEL